MYGTRVTSLLHRCYEIVKSLTITGKKMEAPRSTGVRTVGGASSGPNKEKLGGRLERNSGKQEAGKMFLKQRDRDVIG